ncbi:MAG: AAA family ATPase, partial [Haloechinothrix sp.]
VPAQRISDWRRGRNVPARFAGLAAVLRVLIGEARKRRPQPVVPGLYDVAAWQALWESALASPLTPDQARDGVPRPAPPEVAACPYRGLASFRQEDSAWFFGRERSTKDLIERMRQARVSGGFVVLVGPSGAGKSSLVRAGLGPELSTTTLSPEQTSGWPVVTMTPGADPLEELGRQIGELTASLRDATESACNGTDPTATTGFADNVRHAVAACAAHRGVPDAGLVLVVDQFEEVFTLCADEDTRLLFIHALHAICASADGAPAPGLVVLGVRADFYDRCLAYPELVEAMQSRQMALGAMSASELRDAMVRPAKAVGLQFETGLVELMLADLGVTVRLTKGKVTPAGYDAGALPLLSHALLATWQRRQAGKLTISGYRATGGIHGAVATTAERAWAELNQAGRFAARRMLLRLVQVGETTRDVRRRASRRELITHHACDRAAAEQAIEVLARARLVTLDAESVEITHEALLEAWPRLRGWIDDNRADTLARQRLEMDAAAWAEQDRDSSLLYRGARLDNTERWAKGLDSVETTPVATAFLAASAQHRRRSTWLRRAAVALVCVFALIAGVAAAVAINERDEAEYRQLVTEVDRLRETEPSVAAQLALAAHLLRPEDTSIYTRLLSLQQMPLAKPLGGHTGAVYLTSFSPDGGTLATASYDRTVRLWDVRDRDNPRPLGTPLDGHTSWVSTAVFSPDGRTLATAGDDHTLRLWDVADREHPKLIGKPVAPGNGTIYLVAFSPDGTTLVTANEDHTAGLWNVADPAKPTRLGESLSGHTAAVRSVAFSPDGQSLATTGDDGTVRIWDVTDPAEATPRGQPLTGHTGDVHSVAFSPDSRVLASGGDDKTVRRWDVATGEPLGPPLSGHTAPVWSVLFSPDGTMLASGGHDSTVRLWNVTDADRAIPLGQPLESRGNGVFAVGVSPDGRTLSTGSGDGVVRLWSIPRTILLGHTEEVTTPGFRPDGRVLATGSSDATVRLWDVADPADPMPLGRPLVGHRGYVTHQVFGPNGRLLATASGDKTVRLWDVSDPKRAKPIGKPLRLDTRYAAPLAISPDGRTLATGDDDESVALWDITDPSEPGRVGEPLTGHTGYVNTTAFSPDGSTLVTVSSDQTIRLWDVRDPARATPLGGPLTAHTGDVLAAAFSPDGNLLATGSGDKTIRLWDVRDPARATPLGRPLTAHTEAIGSVSFSRDGRTLASGSSDTTIRIWDVSDPAEVVPIGQAITDHVGTEHVLAFSPVGDVLATGGGDNTARLWDLDGERAIARICTTTRGVLTPEQWQRNAGQFPYQPPCG